LFGVSINCGTCASVSKFRSFKKLGCFEENLVRDAV